MVWWGAAAPAPAGTEVPGAEAGEFPPLSADVQEIGGGVGALVLTKAKFAPTKPTLCAYPPTPSLPAATSVAGLSPSAAAVSVIDQSKR